MSFKKLTLAAALFLPSLEGYSNVLAGDFEPFTPLATEQVFTTVHSSSTLPKGSFGLGIFTNLATNTLPRYDGKAVGHRLKAYDTLVGMDGGLGYGLTERLEIGLGLQGILTQSIAEDGDRGQFLNNGITDARIYVKGRIYRGAFGGLGLVLSHNKSLTIDNPYRGFSSSPATTLELVWDKTYEGFDFGANIGYRFRNEGSELKQFPIRLVGDQSTASVAVAHELLKTGIKLGAEIYSGFPKNVDQSEIHRRSDVVESIITFRTFEKRGLNFFGGVGSELQHGLHSADVRLYAGLTYVTGEDRKPALVKKSIPAKKPISKPIPRKEELIELNNVQFAFDSPALVAPNSRTYLASLCPQLSDDRVSRITLDGHTDSIGQQSYNNQLGFDRSNEIAKVLVEECGLNKSIIFLKSYGESSPASDEKTSAGRFKNRRVTIRLLLK